MPSRDAIAVPLFLLIQIAVLALLFAAHCCTDPGPSCDEVLADCADACPADAGDMASAACGLSCLLDYWECRED